MEFCFIIFLMIELLVIKILSFSTKKNLAHNAYEWPERMKWNEITKKKRLEWMWAKFMIQTIRYLAIGDRRSPFIFWLWFIQQNFNIHCIKYDIILHQLNWSGIANVTLSFALKWCAQKRENSFNSLAYNNRFVFDIFFTLTNSFIRYSPFSVHCIYLLLFGHCFWIPTESGCCKHFARIYVYFRDEFEFNSIQSPIHTLTHFSIHPTAIDILFAAQTSLIFVPLDDVRFFVLE